MIKGARKICTDEQRKHWLDRGPLELNSSLNIMKHGVQ